VAQFGPDNVKFDSAEHWHFFHIGKSICECSNGFSSTLFHTAFHPELALTPESTEATRPDQVEEDRPVKRCKARHVNVDLHLLEHLTTVQEIEEVVMLSGNVSRNPAALNVSETQLPQCQPAIFLQQLQDFAVGLEMRGFAGSETLEYELVFGVE
jgi:hypothetical protein